MSHMKSKHLKSTQVQDFSDIEKDFRKHTSKKGMQTGREKQRKIDEEGFKRQQNEVKQAQRDKLRKIDEKGLRKQMSKAKQETRNRKKEANKEGFMEDQRMAGQVSKNKRLNDDPKKYRKLEKQACQKYKRTQKSSHQAAVKRFYQETRYGPVFGCVCCRIENFRHNVVPWNEKTQAQIRTKAKDAHIRDYNSKLEQVDAT